MVLSIMELENKKLYMRELAPIVLFVYNRIGHTTKTIEALKKNELAKESNLYIFSDGSKTHSESEKVNSLRAYLKTVDGFKSISIIESTINKGLGSSIIDGVSEIINKFGKVIVMEDDLVSSTNYLKFMNDALDFYQEKKKVWHISGWSYPISKEGLNDTFLWKTMNCWGWATWKDRWAKFEKNPSNLVSEFSKTEIYEFDIDGTYSMWSQVLSNLEGRINSWAIFWYATIYINNGLCLNPSKSLIDNIGLDGSGTNSGTTDAYQTGVNEIRSLEFETDLFENKVAKEKIKQFYMSIKPSLLTRIKLKIKLILR